MPARKFRFAVHNSTQYHIIVSYDSSLFFVDLASQVEMVKAVFHDCVMRCVALPFGWTDAHGLWAQSELTKVPFWHR